MEIKRKHIYSLFATRCMLFLFSVLFAHTSNLLAQNDTLLQKRMLRNTLASSALIAVGSSLSGSTIEYNLKTNLRNAVGNEFEFEIENQLQYAPIVELYLADILGVKARNHWFDQTKYLLLANASTAAITHLLKSLINKERPNGFSYSFPSGHTSFSFTNAAVLHKEFQTTAPWFSYSGYLFSTTTGTMRMVNNKHWFSDVLVGAGIALLVTEIIYYYEPLKNFNPFLKSQNITLLPQINEWSYGIYFSHQF